ncbi:hypothetical protein [Ornithinimicrobium kibberense]|uniref:hypothetical protein n=1 Tax=Ornithinimicrobium kibberense TaxID=282060 RepID=UPI003622E40E
MKTTSSCSSRTWSEWAASTGRMRQLRSSTGARGGTGTRCRLHVASPIARNPVSIPCSRRSSDVLSRMAPIRREASRKATCSRTSSDSSVGRPESSLATPPGWARLRSNVPVSDVRCHSRVFGPPSSATSRRHRPRARWTASTRAGSRAWEGWAGVTLPG